MNFQSSHAMPALPTAAPAASAAPAAARWTPQPLAGWLGEHRLQLQRARRHAAQLDIGAPQHQRWQRLFDVPPSALVPLALYQAAAARLHGRLFDELGVQRRHRLLLRHRTVHDAAAAQVASAAALQLAAGLKRALRLGDDKVLLEIETLVYDERGRRLATVEDGFLVRELPVRDLFALPQDRVLMRGLHGLRHRGALLDAAAPGACQRPLALSRALIAGHRRLAGGRAPLHERLLGLDAPAVPGLLLRDLAMRELAAIGTVPQRLQITFARPCAAGATLSLVVAGPRFEIHDGCRRLIAYGSAAGAA